MFQSAAEAAVAYPELNGKPIFHPRIFFDPLNEIIRSKYDDTRPWHAVPLNEIKFEVLLSFRREAPQGSRDINDIASIPSMGQRLPRCRHIVSTNLALSIPIFAEFPYRPL